MKIVGILLLEEDQIKIEPDKQNFDKLKWNKSDINIYTINGEGLFDQNYFGEKLSQENLIIFFTK